MCRAGPSGSLFLCTGNACRSQMAEGLARALGGDRVEVYSAGLEAHGVNPRAVAAIKEIRIDISQHTSDEVDQGLLRGMDYVITLCSHADENCPLTPPSVSRIHWAFEDPARAVGSEEEIMGKFREVRDGIGAKIRELLHSL